MKTFEEKWTAWVDGQLTGKELVEFEASLPDKTAAEAERDEARKLGVFLKAHATAPAMANEEFFQHQLRQQIEADRPSELKPAGAEAEEEESWWTIGRLLWTGAASLAVFVVCTFFIMRPSNPAGQSAYFDQIRSARVDPAVSPNATISIFPVENKEERVTVLWLEGLQALPSEYAAK